MTEALPREIIVENDIPDQSSGVEAAKKEAKTKEPSAILVESCSADIQAVHEIGDVGSAESPPRGDSATSASTSEENSFNQDEAYGSLAINDTSNCSVVTPIKALSSDVVNSGTEPGAERAEYSHSPSKVKDPAIISCKVSVGGLLQDVEAVGDVGSAESPPRGDSATSASTSGENSSNRDEAYGSWASHDTFNSSVDTPIKALSADVVNSDEEPGAYPNTAVKRAEYPPSTYEGEKPAVYSCKVFAGGLPQDMEADALATFFGRLGDVTIDWPHKSESTSIYPPKGFVFLLYKDEESVHKLLADCVCFQGRYYTVVSSKTKMNKLVQVRPWRLLDSQTRVRNIELNMRNAVFIGGVPRMVTSADLALRMSKLYGPVAYASVDVSADFQYPKGSGRVVFRNHASSVTAISCRFMSIKVEDSTKRLELKPYIEQYQQCDGCNGGNCEGSFAAFYCGHVTCLSYLCDVCWYNFHSSPSTKYHKPLLQKTFYNHESL